MVGENSFGNPLPAFDYSAVPFSRWPNQLEELRASGNTQIRTKVYWGEHEQIRGVRDFSQASRLRLERYLGLAHERGLAIDLVIGFPLGGKTFPEWTLSSSSRDLVFESLCTERPCGLSLTEIPALDDWELKESFLNFVSELLSLVDLYQYPEGPVTSVSVDVGLGLGSLSIVSNPRFVELLTHRYHEVSWLNQVYGTNFGDFKSVGTAQGFRVLGDKRPWLAAYDYKCTQKYLVSELEQAIAHLPEAKALERILQFSPVLPVLPSIRLWEICLDGTLLGESPLGIYPFAPEGQLKSSAILVYRLFRYLEQKSKRHSVALNLLPFHSSSAEPQADLLVVICGKYLSKEHHQILDRHLQKGKQIYFPFGLPQYDQDMKFFDWHGVTASERLKSSAHGEGPTSGFARENGWVWVQNSPLDYGDDLWNLLKATAERLIQKSSAQNS